MASKKKAKYDRVLAIDLGNGLVKVRSITQEGRDYDLTLPSAWAYSKEVGESVNHKVMDLDLFTIGDTEYVWGNEIVKVKGIKPTYGHENRYLTEAFKIMAQIAMAKAVHDLQITPQEKILVVTGVPSTQTGTSREEDIVEAFLGTNDGLYQIGVNEDEVTFKVAHVEVMPQALSTVIGRYLSEDGGVEDADYEEIKVAVIDIGGGTTDLDIVHGLRRQKGYHSIPKGFRDVYDTVRVAIKEEYPDHDVTDYELLAVLDETAERSKKGSVKTKQKYEYKPSRLKSAVDFTSALNNGILELSIDIQQAIMSKWKDQTDLDEILLVGGSAELFKDYIDRIVEGITIPANSGNSNVEGYYRYGVYMLAGEQ